MKIDDGPAYPVKTHGTNDPEASISAPGPAEQAQVHGGGGTDGERPVAIQGEERSVWLILPSTSFPSAPATAGSTSELSLPLAERLASSAELSGKPRAARFWQKRWAQGSFLRSLSGATCEPSTAARGAASWIASLRGSRVSPSPQQGSSVERTTLAIYGRKSLESLRKHNRASCSWKTCPDSSPFPLFTTAPTSCSTSPRSKNPRGDAELRKAGGVFVLTETVSIGDCLGNTASPRSRWCAGSWKRWGIALRRDCLRRRKSARRTSGSGCSSSAWPTIRREADYPHKGGNPTLVGAAVMWPTPNVPDRGAESAESKAKRGAGGVDLQTVAQQFLGSARPTPGANDHKGSAQMGQRRGQLDEAAEQMWQTPASDSFRSRSGDRKDEMGLDQQARFHSSLPAPVLDESGNESSPSAPTSRPRLNPAFVEWMMGVPEGWTACACSATAWSLWLQRMRSQLCGLVCAIGGVE